MAIGMPPTEADSFLAKFTGSYVQLHTADPGAAGTTAISTAAPARKQVTFGTATTAAGIRQRLSTAIVRWDAADVTGTESATHCSIWSAATGGDFLQSGLLDPALALTSGQPSELPVGSVKATIKPVAS